MSFVKGLSANFVSTPLMSSLGPVGSTDRGSESTLQLAGHSSGFSSIVASSGDPAQSLLRWYAFMFQFSAFYTQPTMEWSNSRKWKCAGA